IGLIKAVSTFNHKKGASLASYASKCIENEILMNIRAERKRSGEVSIQDSIGMDKDGNDVSLLDILGTEDTIVSDEVERRLDVAKLKQVMEQNLTKREYLVVRLRYGLTGGPGMPQRVVAQMLGISRSYVSRIEKKAIEKLTRAFEKENR
ncbi:MAG: sigma-70 family RNA polymerase sigma factor, partial [Eubacteriales bacterium]|nr:sigma-70 family RNA polymerase sigma factor [Eubacteriales bacterium]